MALDDDELIEICVGSDRHDPAPFEVLVRRYEPVVHRVCLRILGSHSDADDVSQNVFLRVFRYLPAFERRSTFKTWLITIARNECFTFISKQKNAGLGDVDYATIGDSEFSASNEHLLEDQVGAGDMLAKTLASLSLRDREILTLRFVAELGLEEIATALDLSLSAAKMRLYRAVERFTETSDELSNT